MALSVLYVDEHVIALDKLAGQLVIPGRGPTERTLLDEGQETFGRLWVVHRLDRGTSGALLFARTAEAHRTLNLAFDRREVSKRYLALVRGTPPPEARLEVPVAPARRGRMRPGRKGRSEGEGGHDRREARRSPSWRRRRCRPWRSSRLYPRPAEPHQIRVHLAWAGTPLAVDPDYGDAGPLLDMGGVVLLARTPLHAASLELRHPASGAPLRIEVPPPQDMARTIAVLRAHGALR